MDIDDDITNYFELVAGYDSWLQELSETQESALQYALRKRLNHRADERAKELLGQFNEDMKNALRALSSELDRVKLIRSEYIPALDLRTARAVAQAVVEA